MTIADGNFQLDVWHLEFKARVEGSGEEPNDHSIVDLHGRIYVDVGSEDEMADQARAAGSLELSLCRFDEWEPFDALDAHSAELEEYCALYIEHGHGTEAVEQQFEPIGTDLLIVRRVRIAEPYRGHGLGLLAVRRVADMFGWGCGLVALKPFPLQFAGKGAECEGREFRAARKKLTRYWARLGFESIDGTCLMAHSTAHRWPEMDEMLRAWAVCVN